VSTEIYRRPYSTTYTDANGTVVAVGMLPEGYSYIRQAADKYGALLVYSLSPKSANAKCPSAASARAGGHSDGFFDGFGSLSDSRVCQCAECRAAYRNGFELGQAEAVAEMESK